MALDRYGERGEAAVRPFRMLVVGVGGGGCNALARMYREWPPGLEAAAVNTDSQSLSACGVPTRVQIGRNLTQGMGAGGDPAVGKLAAEDDADMLRELVSQADVVCIVAAMGGGTGTGAAPILARLAREEGALTMCFATLPFDFEGERRQRQAREGLRALRMHADVVVRMPNQLLLEMVENRTSLVEGFAQADRMLGVGLRALWNLLDQTGIINLTFSDLRHLVEHSGGECAFGYGEGTGPDKAADAVAALSANPLLDHGSVLSRSGALMVNIVGGSDLTLAEVQKVMSQLTAHARDDARLFMGATVDEAIEDTLRLTVLAAENWQEEQAAAREPPKIVEAVEDAAGTRHGNGAKPQQKRPVQVDFDFEPGDRGRFRNVEPTIYDGEDLDIPTYVRRGIKLSFEK